MKTITEEIQQFDQSISNAHSQIAQTILEINRIDEDVKKRILAFRDEVKKIRLNGTNQYEKELQQLLVQYQNDCDNWYQAIQDFIDGKEFVNQFERSVLVVVFGNVNVGKSSVGNMIAGVIDPDSSKTPESDSEILKNFFGAAPEFFEYDLAGKDHSQGARKKEQNYFKEGHVETTANIQYFTRKDGLTWTDSPGICSVNQENGDLAKKYVEFADLVIFITTSSSPAKNDEVEELKKLFGKKKTVLILNNKSDYYDKDEIDGQLVRILRPKSDTDRQKQENYIKQVFEDTAHDVMSSIDAVSISTYLAMDALRNNDDRKFEQSGFPRFYKKLGSIFGNDAVKLKMAAPRSRLNTMIEEILNGGTLGAHRIEGVSQYLEKIRAIKNTVSDLQKRMEHIGQDAATTIKARAMNRITDAVRDAAHIVQTGGKEISVQDQINKIVTEEAGKALESALQEVLADYSNDMVSQIEYRNSSNIKVSAVKETVERVVYDVKTVSRDPEGLIEHVEHWFFKKEFTKETIRQRKITEEFINGDTSSAALAEISAELNQAINAYITAFVASVKEGYFGKEESMLDALCEQLVSLEKDLKELLNRA